MLLHKLVVASRRSLHVFIFLIAFVSSLAGAANSAPEISLQDLKKAVDEKKVFLIDANGTGSYKSGHIPGAIHYSKHEEKLASVLPADKSSLIVAYCGGPMCSAWEDAAKEAQKAGYTNVKHLKAGIKGWKEAKYPTDI